MLSQMSMNELFTSFAFISSFCFICGWIADRILGFTGFGAVGNWLMLLSGSYLGMYGFNYLGYQFHWNPPLTIAVVSASASAMLIFFATIKTALNS